MKILLALCLLMLVLSIAYAQTQPLANFACKDGWCYAKEEEVKRLIRIIEWMDSKIEELQSKTGCT